MYIKNKQTNHFCSCFMLIQFVILLFISNRLTTLTNGSSQAKYGFALQWGMLKSRIYQLRLAQHDVKYGRIPPIKYFYWDRSMIGDYIFALWYCSQYLRFLNNNSKPKNYVILGITCKVAYRQLKWLFTKANLVAV